MGIWDSLLASLHGLPTTLGLTGPTSMQMTPYGQLGPAGQQAMMQNQFLPGVMPQDPMSNTSSYGGLAGLGQTGQGQQGYQQQPNYGALGQLYLNYLQQRRLTDLAKYQYAGLHTSPMTQMQPLPLGQMLPLQLPKLG